MKVFADDKLNIAVVMEFNYEREKYIVEGQKLISSVFVFLYHALKGLISLGECNTILSAYTLYRHLE